jgi:hypothetical protein
MSGWLKRGCHASGFSEGLITMEGHIRVEMWIPPGGICIFPLNATRCDGQAAYMETSLESPTLVMVSRGN